MPEVVVKVAPGSSIAGRVIDGDGKPVANAVVAASRADGAEATTIVNGRVTSGVQAMTTASGAYEVKGLSPGTYRLSALDRGQPLRARGKKTTKVTIAKLQKK